MAYLNETAVYELRKSVEGKELADLHTHLLGMGNAKFWIDTVMKKIIPYLKNGTGTKKIAAEFYPNNGANVTHENWFKFDCATFADEFDALKDKHDNFTLDVVYHLDSLCTACGVSCELINVQQKNIFIAG